MYLTSDGLRNLQVHFCNFNVFFRNKSGKASMKIRVCFFHRELDTAQFRKMNECFPNLANYPRSRQNLIFRKYFQKIIK